MGDVVGTVILKGYWGTGSGDAKRIEMAQNWIHCGNEGACVHFTMQ
jgi:hypothetical protein